MNRNGLVSSAKDSSQLLMSMVGSGQSSEGDGRKFNALIKSIITAGSKNSETKRKPALTVKQTVQENFAAEVQTQGWDKKVPFKNAAQAMERLKSLVEDGSLSEKELSRLSGNELEKLLDWLLSGADGMFQPIEAEKNQKLFSWAEIFAALQGQAVSSESVAESSESVEIADFNLLEKQQLLKQQAESGNLNTGAGNETLKAKPSRLELLFGLQTLNAEDLQQFSHEFSNFLRQAAKNILAQGSEDSLTADADWSSGLKNLLSDAKELSIATTESGATPVAAGNSRISMPEGVLAVLEQATSGELAGQSSDLLQYMLARGIIGASDISRMLVEAADKLTLAQGVMDVTNLDVLPAPVLEALAVKVLKPQVDSVDHLAELKLKASDSSFRIFNFALPGSDNDTTETGEGLVVKLPDSKVQKSEFEPGNTLETAFALPTEESALSELSLDNLSGLSKENPDSGILAKVEAGAEPAGLERKSVPTAADSVPRYIDAEKNINRIGEALRVSVRRNISTVTLQFSPPDIGKVRMHVSVDNGIVNANIRTESSEARNILISNMSQLRESMQVQGIELGEFEINYNERGQDEQTANDFRQKRAHRDAQADNFGENSEEEAVNYAEISLSGSGLLNMYA